MSFDPVSYAMGARAGGLPPVTPGDEGKVLAVHNGAWAAVDKSPLVVHYTVAGEPAGDTYPLDADTGLEEIAAAFQAGREVLGQVALDGSIFTVPPVLRMAPDAVVYTTVGAMGSTWVAAMIRHYADMETEFADLIIRPLAEPD